MTDRPTTDAHPLLGVTAQHLAMVNQIADEFDGKDIPAEAAHMLARHVSKASEYIAAITREARA